MREPIVLIVLVLSSLVAAGCLADDPVAVVDPPLVQGLRLGDAEAPVGAPLRWMGATLVAQEQGDGPSVPPERVCISFVYCQGEAPLECAADNCERIPFEVLHGGTDRVLEVSIRWPTDYVSWVELWVEDADGAVVAKGANSEYSYSVAQVALLPEPMPGAYTAVVVAADGTTPYEGVMELEPVPMYAADERVLPDLVTMTPTDLRIETPGSGGVGVFMLAPGDVRRLADATGSKGCGLEEVVDHGDQRCLRFSNAVGNLGPGPLEIRLPAVDATDGRFLQRVYFGNGGYEDVDAGQAEFHEYHAHWHNAAANRYAVFAYDEATGVRGEEVGVGTKAGVCLANVGLIDLGLPTTAVPTWNGTECFAPVADPAHWAMGLAANWYDEYPWVLTDQYVDITGVPDGTYTLCSIVNQDATLMELDPTNNEACAPLRLTGDTVEVLGDEPYHKETGPGLGR